MTKRQFIENIIDEATVGGLIPMNLPLRRIEKIVSKAIAKFIDNDNRMTQEDVIFIDVSKLSSGCLTIKLPEDIYAVTRLEHVSTTQFASLMSDGGVGVINSDIGGGVLSWVSREMYSSFLKMHSNRFIPYDFSYHTHELILEAQPKSNLFAEVSRIIKDEDAYTIDDLETYCAAKITLDFIRANNFFGVKLIGGRQINFSEMKSDAQKQIDEIQNMWDNDIDGVMLLD